MNYSWNYCSFVAFGGVIEYFNNSNPVLRVGNFVKIFFLILLVLDVEMF
jgi:hypothetical protein